MSTRFVRISGDDTTPDASGNRPALTIARALAVAMSGDTIDIGAGLFTDSAGITLTKNLSFVGVKVNNDVTDSVNNTIIRSTIGTTLNAINSVTTGISMSFTDLIIDASGASTGNIVSINPSGTNNAGTFNATNVVFNGTASFNGLRLKNVTGGTINNCIFPSTATGTTKYGLLLDGAKNFTVSNSTLKLNSIASVQITNAVSNINLATGNTFVNDRFTDICGAFAYASASSLSNAALVRIDLSSITYGKNGDDVMVTLPNEFVTGTEYRNVTGSSAAGFNPGANTLLTNNTHIFRNATFLTAYAGATGYVRRDLVTPTTWQVDSPFNIIQAMKLAGSGHTINLSAGRFIQTVNSGILPVRSAVIGADRQLTIKGVRENDSETDYIRNTVLEGGFLADWGMDLEMSNFTLENIIYKHPVYMSGSTSSYFSMYIGKGQVGTARPDINNVTIKNVKIVVPEDGSTGFTRGITTNSVDGLVFDCVEINGLESTAMSLSSTKNCIIKNCKLPLSGKFNRLNDSITINSSPTSIDGSCRNIDMRENNTFVNNDLENEVATGNISGNGFGLVNITRSGPVIENILLPSSFTEHNTTYIAGTAATVYVSNVNIAKHSKFIAKHAATYVRQMLNEPNKLYVDAGFKINNAVAYAASGDLVKLGVGLFQENMIVNKPLTLIGEKGPLGTSTDSTVITYAASNGEYPRIQANNVTFKNTVFVCDASKNIVVFQAQGNQVSGQWTDITNLLMENIKFSGVNRGVAFNGVNGVELSGCEITSTLNYTLTLTSTKNFKLTNSKLEASALGTISVIPTKETNPIDIGTYGIDLTNSNNIYTNNVFTIPNTDTSNLITIRVSPTRDGVVPTGTPITYGVLDISKSLILAPSIRYYAVDTSGNSLISNIRNFVDISGFNKTILNPSGNFEVIDMISSNKFIYENGEYTSISTPPIVIVDANGQEQTIAPIEAEVVIPPAAGVTSFTVDVLTNPEKFVDAGENKPVLETEYSESTGKTVVAAIQINADDVFCYLNIYFSFLC
jgi:hypothetical protein